MTSYLTPPLTSNDLKDIIQSLNVIPSHRLKHLQSWNFFISIFYTVTTESNKHLRKDIIAFEIRDVWEKKQKKNLPPLDDSQLNFSSTPLWQGDLSDFLHWPKKGKQNSFKDYLYRMSEMHLCFRSRVQSLLTQSKQMQRKPTGKCRALEVTRLSWEVGSEVSKWVCTAEF